jgi:hypothetical protein
MWVHDMAGHRDPRTTALAQPGAQLHRVQAGRYDREANSARTSPSHALAPLILAAEAAT